MYAIVILFFVSVAFVQPQNNASTIEIYQPMANHKGTLMDERMSLHTATRYYRLCMDIPLQSWIELKEIIQQTLQTVQEDDDSLINLAENIEHLNDNLRRKKRNPQTSDPQAEPQVGGTNSTPIPPSKPSTKLSLDSLPIRIEGLEDYRNGHHSNFIGNLEHTIQSLLISLDNLGENLQSTL